MSLVKEWEQRAEWLKQQTLAIYLAYKDPRTPWYARVCSALIVAYAFSPIDLIPDFIPVLGYLDDLILLPLGIALVLRLIPDQVMAESQQEAVQLLQDDRPVSYWAAASILMVWAVLALLGVKVVIDCLG